MPESVRPEPQMPMVYAAGQTLQSAMCRSSMTAMILNAFADIPTREAAPDSTRRSSR